MTARSAVLERGADSWPLTRPRDAASDRLPAPLAGPDPDDILERQDEDLPVPDLPFLSRPRAPDDRRDRRFHELLVDFDLELHLPDQVHLVLVPAVDLRVPLLAAEPLDVAHREPEDLHLAQSLLDRFEPRRLHDGDDVLHSGPPCDGSGRTGVPYESLRLMELRRPRAAPSEPAPRARERSRFAS